MGIKSLIKQSFPGLHRLHIRYIKWREYKRHMHYNKIYKCAIDKMLQQEYLETCVQRICAGEANGYYVIAMNNPRNGIYGLLNAFLPHIAYAVSKGFIPVIDMKNYPSIYQYSDENAWETYFSQPCNIGLDDLVKYKVHYAPVDFWYRWEPSSCPVSSDDELKMWSQIYKHFIHHNRKSSEYIEREKSTILLKPDKTIGVIYRGTDYTQGRPKGHPIQPSMAQLADKVNEFMVRFNCEYIYLASDEKKIVDFFETRFPGRVLINQRVYYDEATNIDYANYNTDHIGISGATFDRKDNKYLIGIEYISSMNLVANCSYFVAGACGGTTAVLYMNGLSFRSRYIFDLGKY